MPQTIIYILLFLALALPVLGAATLRVLGARLAIRQLYGGALLIFGIAVLSVFLLVRSAVPSLQVGGLSILLPVAAPEDAEPAAALPSPVADIPTAGTAAATAGSTAATAGTLASTPTPIPATATPTAAPTATALPTEAPTAAPTEAPTAPPPPAPRTYTVQAGDTLASIARQFNVTVPALIETNKLTPAQADSLRVGQELVIP
ncbi:MAG: LysM peptidoglycan-binding domain-containing protein [Kouleothrix sp.]|nr:LysM peptidoglycan-binding domain-containing protein [Kouleothrix sp.]